MRNYKLMIMGASGVGKTVFLTSYFYSVLRRERGRYRVEMDEKKAAGFERSPREMVETMIDTMFENKDLPTGTDSFIDLSFKIPKLNARIQLRDLPGGYTTDTEQWVKTDVLPLLRTADGIIFFISAEDLQKRFNKAVSENVPFSAAIHELRTSAGTRGADVPIWFIFTKGDLVPDATIEQLKKSIEGLTAGAFSSRREGNVLEKAIFTKGKHVKFYKTSALGPWKDAKTVPDHYKPENVVESMDAIFSEIASSKKEVSTRKKILLGATACIVYAGTVGGLWLMEKARWTKTSLSVNAMIESRQYDQAQQTLKNYIDRTKLPFFLQPEALRSGEGAQELFEKVVLKNEEVSFAALQSVLKIVDLTKIPKGDARYYFELGKSVLDYLNNNDFKSAVPDHYAKVEEAAKYFATGVLLSYQYDMDEKDFVPVVNAYLESMSDDSEFFFSQWRAEAEQNMAAGLSRWLDGHLKTAATGKDYHARIVDIQTVLALNDDIPASVVKVLNDYNAKYAAHEDKYWSENLGKLVASAGKVDILKRSEFWENVLQTEEMPEKYATKIKGFVDAAYAKTAEQLCARYKDPDALSSALSAFPRMPQASVQIVQNRVTALLDASNHEFVKLAKQAKTLDSLEQVARRAQNFMNKHANYRRDFDKVLDSSANSLVQNSFNSWTQAAETALKRNDFVKAVNTIENAVGGDYSRFEMLKNLPSLQKAYQNFNSRRENLLSKTNSANYAYCKKKFDDYKRSSSASVNTAISSLNDYIALWDGNTDLRMREVRQAKEYLEAIRRGCPMKIIFDGGYFPRYDDAFSDPDVYFDVWINGQYLGHTSTVQDSQHPEFNEGADITWTRSMTIRIKAYDANVLSDVCIFDNSYSFTALPKNGVREGHVLYDGSNRCDFSYEIEVPACPW